MVIWLILALVFAFLEMIAIVKNVNRLEYFAKPAVMVCLFLWLYTSTGLQRNTLWFGWGILFALAGDVLLMSPQDRFFLFGLVAFLFTHIFYITGFQQEFTSMNIWSFTLAIFLAINVSRLLRRIVSAMRARDENKLVIPFILYGAVISVMLYAAMSTISNPAWKIHAAAFVSLGAFLFCASDILLAWNRFVSPVRNGRVWNMALYHLGQIGLIAGVVSQFA